MRPFLAATILPLFAALAGAQSPADALRAETKPSSLRDLPANYRAVSLGNPLNELFGPRLGGRRQIPGSDAGAALLLMASFAIWTDPEEWAAFLEGRTPRIRTLALGPDFSLAAFESDPEAAPIFVERWIERGGVTEWSPLPALDRAGLLGALTPFREIRTQSELAAAKTQTLSNLKQIGTGVMILLTDLNDVFPKVDSTAEMRRLLAPYLKNESLWTTRNPNGGRILYNVALSGRNATELDAPHEVPILWEERAWPDGKRAVAFTDGHVKRLDAAEWERLWTAELERRGKRRR